MNHELVRICDKALDELKAMREERDRMTNVADIRFVSLQRYRSMPSYEFSQGDTKHQVIGTPEAIAALQMLISGHNKEAH